MLLPVNLSKGDNSRLMTMAPT